MRPALRAAAVASCVLLLAPMAFGQEETPPPTPAQLAAMERVRPQVEAIWLEVRTPPKPGEDRTAAFWQVTDRLIAIGPDVVPFVTSEIDLMDPSTFHLCAYVLGQLGGPEADAALRKAVRAADTRGGKYGIACKRFALFGLALLGAPDVTELMENGEPMPGTQMIPDLPLPTHLAIVVGPAAAPVVERQLDAYRVEPQDVLKLGDTLLEVGRVGDATVLPKILPLLTNESPEIRALAADAVSRLGDPALCEKLLPNLSSATQEERRLVAKSFERWKPEPCYKAMVARLEVEDDIGVRGPLYNAIASMGGEASLDVLRSSLRGGNQFDQALVIGLIGQIGSKKGLNVLRALLADEAVYTVVRAMQAMGVIGGEGAVETLMATTSDGRPGIAPAARDVLADMGIKRVAPQFAAELLKTVREPVTDLSFRPLIAQWGEVLVKFGYTDAIDQLKAAAAIQPDPEIKESVSSCLRRLQLIAKNHDDVTAWDTAAGSQFADVRRLAYRRLAEIGSPSAVRALTTRLAKTDLPGEDRIDALVSIGDARTEGAAELVERHLVDPSYDVGELLSARPAAAYAARRLGGERMAKALRQSAVRRDGREFATLLYLAVLEKEAALPTLKTLRARRLRYPISGFGQDETTLDAIIADLSAGRDIKQHDVKPEGHSGH